MCAHGEPMLVTYGPFGYDITPPQSPAPIALIEVSSGSHAILSWNPAGDAGSGVAGYRIYVGTDAGGTSDWFVHEPQLEMEALAAGRYVLRIQPIDRAGNAGIWTTIGEIVSCDG